MEPKLAFSGYELFPVLRAFQVFPIDSLVILRLDLSATMRADGVGAGLDLR